jgi:hypothetical protein
MRNNTWLRGLAKIRRPAPNNHAAALPRRRDTPLFQIAAASLCTPSRNCRSLETSACWFQLP